jgi:hypothetical protein
MSVDSPGSLNRMLDTIVQASRAGEVSFRAILNAVGQRSFGPVLLLAGLITILPPIGIIPGVPTAMAALVLLTAGQILCARRTFWFPHWLLAFHADAASVKQAVNRMRGPAGWIDRVVHKRLTLFVRGPAVYGIAGVCVLIALGMPPMEFVPFSAAGAGAALVAFGLALVGDDGLLALTAFAITVGTFSLLLVGLL